MKHSAPFWQLVQDHQMATFAGLDTLAAWPEVGGVPRLPDPGRPDYGERQLLPGIEALQAAGCQTVAVMDMYDPAVETARREFGLDAFGALEASLAAARRAGASIGWLTAREGVSERFLAQRLLAHGEVPRTVRPLTVFDYDLLVDSLTCRSRTFLDDFDRAATACVEAGADVVVPVCVFFGLLCGKLHRTFVPGTEIPIIDPFAAVAAAARARFGVRS